MDRSGNGKRPGSPPCPQDRTPSKRFVLKGQHNPEYWQFTELIKHPDKIVLCPSQLKSKDAICAFCIRCAKDVDFTVGRHDVGNHMSKEHREDVEAYLLIAKGLNPPNPPHSRAANPRKQQKTSHKKLLPISAESQQRVNSAAALWVARNNRPLGIVTDSGLVDLFMIATAEICGYDIKVPGRTEVHTEVQHTTAQLRSKLKEFVLEECENYSVTTDIWTDRPGRSYISLTLHYLTEDFLSRNWTLEVMEFSGKHTGDAIADSLGGLLEAWDLEKTRCAKLLRDGAANAIKAGKNLGVDHMSYIAHSLHLVVSGVLVKKNSGMRLGPARRNQLSLPLSGTCGTRGTPPCPLIEVHPQGTPEPVRCLLTRLLVPQKPLGS